ncbi:hypothetical protein ACJJTC_008335 [Scirpophaga incertulas]
MRCWKGRVNAAQSRNPPETPSTSAEGSADKLKKNQVPPEPPPPTARQRYRKEAGNPGRRSSTGASAKSWKQPPKQLQGTQRSPPKTHPFHNFSSPAARIPNWLTNSSTNRGRSRLPHRWVPQRLPYSLPPNTSTPPVVKIPSWTITPQPSGVDIPSLGSSHRSRHSPPLGTPATPKTPSFYNSSAIRSKHPEFGLDR